nr:unnamed protein product [Callosobruchus chinensis]
MANASYCLFSIFSVLVCYSSGYDIVAVFPHRAMSHMRVFLSITKALAQKGHKVTVISPYPLDAPMPNYIDVNLRNESLPPVDSLNVGQIDPSSRIVKYFLPAWLGEMASTNCELGMRSEELKRFLGSRTRFDVMITEMFNSDCFIVHAIPVVLNSIMNIVCGAILFCLVSACYVDGYSILVVLSHPGKSHVDVFLPITKALAEKGHKVTVIGHYPLSRPLPNYKDVSLKNESVHFVEAINVGQMDPSSRLVRYFMPTFLDYMGKASCEVGMESKEFQEFMEQRNRHRFDLMIMEMFNSDCFLVVLSESSFTLEELWVEVKLGKLSYVIGSLYRPPKGNVALFVDFFEDRLSQFIDVEIICGGLADIFNVPVIGLSSCTLMPWSSDRFANPIDTGYIPNNLLALSDRMSFLERVENTVVTTLHRFYFNYIMNANDRSIAKKYLGEEGSNIDNAIKRSSLMLVNTHFSLNLPRPFVPNIIEIGGVHIGESKPLPEHLEKWISESTHGVIYMSLGSLLKGHTLPKEKEKQYSKLSVDYRKESSGNGKTTPWRDNPRM